LLIQRSDHDLLALRMREQPLLLVAHRTALLPPATLAPWLTGPLVMSGTWVRGYRRRFPDRPPVEGKPLVTGLPAESRGAPSIPFVGLAEGMFLAALRRAGVPLQQIRPALELVRTKIGIDHALASRKLYVVGAQLLWEVGGEDDIDPEARHGARDLVVLRDGQYVFRQVIEQHLRQITYDETYARRLLLPRYEVARIAADPGTNFGKPYFIHTGTPLYALTQLLKAGESIQDVAADFDLPVDQVTEVAQRDLCRVAA
jgi:uncharacterized protein (DUF433 family)